MTNDGVDKELFICECSSTEHQFVLTYIKGDLVKNKEFDVEWYEEDLLSIEVHLANYKNFWQRLIGGIKYIFGYKSRYGNFDSILFDPKDCDRLIQYLQKFKDSNEAAKQHYTKKGKDITGNEIVAAEERSDKKPIFKSPGVKWKECD